MHASGESTPCGSSPLARGLPAGSNPASPTRGIIPARAGFTSTRSDTVRPSPDHPRSRGVYAPCGLRDEAAQGSSPLARGLRARQTLARRSAADHPRSRGVYPDVIFTSNEETGSSPLARGLPGQLTRPALRRRIIPARAGFTLADPWNPNDEPCYQTAFTFSADLEPAPPSSGSAVVLRRSTMTPSEA